MKIIRPGKHLAKQFKYTCGKCECKFLVEEEDYKRIEMQFYGDLVEFHRPTCKKIIRVPEYRIMRRY